MENLFSHNLILLVVSGFQNHMDESAVQVLV